MESSNTCEMCGKPTSGNNRVRFCANCRKIRNRDSYAGRIERKRRESRPNTITTRFATVIYDPLPVIDGGFTVGSALPKSAFVYMARSGSIGEGFIIQEQSGKQLVLNRSGKFILYKEQHD